jgi:hypothetical protein
MGSFGEAFFIAIKLAVAVITLDALERLVAFGAVDFF